MIPNRQSAKNILINEMLYTLGYKFKVAIS
jgi:hypothetical protein